MRDCFENHMLYFLKYFTAKENPNAHRFFGRGNISYLPANTLQDASIYRRESRQVGINEAIEARNK